MNALEPETLSQLIDRTGVPVEVDPYAAAARRVYGSDSRIEIEDKVILSDAEGGKYVLAWVFVRSEDAFTDPTSAFQRAIEELDEGNPQGAILALRQARPDDLNDDQRKHIDKAIAELDNGSLERAEVFIDLAKGK